MPINDKLIEIEGQRGVFQILIYLQKHGEMISSRLYNNKPNIHISNNTTAKRAIEILLKHKLIYKKENNNTRAIYYCLTKKGIKFCNCIKQIENILNEN